MLLSCHIICFILPAFREQSECSYGCTNKGEHDCYYYKN